jgi:hydroxymethylbilane synthase
MSKKIIRLATRKSPLAMIQAHIVRDALHQHYPDYEVVLVGLRTEGDRMQTQPFEAFSGKGSFISRLEEALLSGEADCAVHSVKDMPAVLADGLTMAAIMARAEPFDRLVGVAHWDALRPGMRVGTSSLRRQRQLKALCPAVVSLPIRGNVDSRLKRLETGDFDALILAESGLKRMDKLQGVSYRLPLDPFLPAAGQGALGIECRSDDVALLALLARLNCSISQACVAAERSVVRALGAHCHMPLAVYAASDEGKSFVLRARFDARQGKVIEASASGFLDDAPQLADTVARLMMDQGVLEYVHEEQSDDDA